jgi:hypothetical protein
MLSIPNGVGFMPETIRERLINDIGFAKIAA